MERESIIRADRFALDDAEIREELNRAVDQSFDQNKVWLVALSVANGAALVALGGRSLEHLGDPVTQLTLPSLWAFSLGLALSGFIYFREMLRSLRRVEMLRHRRARRFGAQEIDAAIVSYESVPVTWWDKRDVWIGLALEVVAASAFLFGLFYPVVVLTKRLIESGSLLG